MNDKLLQDLANKLGTTSEYLWGVLVKQAHAQVYIDIVSDVLGLGLIFVLLKTANYLWKKFKEDDDRDGCAILAVACLFFAVVLSLALIFSIPDTMTAAMNPEYWALDKVLDAIKKSK
jgi:hypothetical protein